MDSVSHACFSYLVCRASGAAETPQAGLLAAGVAVLPDLDFLAEPFLPDLTRFAFHRGPSHSLFMALAAGALAAGALHRLRPPGARVGWIVFLAWTSHVFLDMCTGFGVALWWPLTHARTSIDLLFVVDPLATLPLLAGVLWDLGANRRKVGVPYAARVGLLVFGGYAASAYAIRARLTRDFRARLSRQGREVEAIHAEPTPFNHQLWYLCAKTEDGFLVTYRSLWDGNRWEQTEELPRNPEPLRTFAPQPLADKMKVVLEDWYTCVMPRADRLRIIDLRLGKRYGWEDDDAPFLFIYELWRTSSERVGWSLNKPGSRYDYGRLRTLVLRIAGRIPARRLAAVPVSGEGR